MPSNNGIVPINANGTPTTGVKVVGMKENVTQQASASIEHHANTDVRNFGKSGSVTKQSTTTSSIQERRIELVNAQKGHTSLQLFYAMFGIILMIIQMEYIWHSNSETLHIPCPIDENKCYHCEITEEIPVDRGQMVLHSLRALITASTGLLLYYIYAYYNAECEVMKLKNVLPPKATILTSTLKNDFIFEIILFCIHPFPALENVDPKWPNLLIFTSLMMLTRVFLIVRVVQFRNAFNSTNGWFIGSLTSVDFTAAFFLKSTLKNYPGICMSTCMSLLLLVAGYCLYVVERYLCAFAQDSCCEPMTFSNALWCLVITILTIGYGDVVPNTIPGRMFAVTAGLVGTMFTAVTIAVMSNYLILTRSERKVHTFFKKDENRRMINNHAARAIQCCIQVRVAQLRLRSSKGKAYEVKMLHRAEMRLFEALYQYRKVKRQVSSQDVSDPLDKQLTMLEMMEVNVEYIRSKIEDLSELFHSQMEKKSKRQSKKRVISIRGTSSNNISHRNSSTNLSSNSSQLSQQQETQVTPVPPLARAISGPLLSSVLKASSPPSSPSQSAIPSKASVISESNSPLPVSSPAIEESRKYHQANGKHQEEEGIPEWASALEKTLQMILLQVGKVSHEVETIKSRVNSHMDIVNTRIASIEKKLALNEAAGPIENAHGLLPQGSGASSGFRSSRRVDRKVSRDSNINKAGFMSASSFFNDQEEINESISEE